MPGQRIRRLLGNPVPHPLSTTSRYGPVTDSAVRSTPARATARSAPLHTNVVGTRNGGTDSHESPAARYQFKAAVIAPGSRNRAICRSARSAGTASPNPIRNPAQSSAGNSSSGVFGCRKKSMYPDFSACTGSCSRAHANAAGCGHRRQRRDPIGVTGRRIPCHDRTPIVAHQMGACQSERVADAQHIRTQFREAIGMHLRGSNAR